MHGYIFQDILIHSINVHVLEYNDLIAAMGFFFTKKKKYLLLSKVCMPFITSKHVHYSMLKNLEIYSKFLNKIQLNYCAKLLRAVFSIKI